MVLEYQAAKAGAELALSFVDTSTMSFLNQRFMGGKGPTDVLSFAIDGETGFEYIHGGECCNGARHAGLGSNDRDQIPVIIGDVVVCPSVAKANADDAYNEELELLVVHGILHLAGMDHEDLTPRRQMEERQRELLEMFRRIFPK
ncbi:MAG: rRNA maturation RNase YbeY [Actinobacteria bacterium]|nr:rRNA maturation RNase YbeY [Actinomycetota bacterium]MCL6105017.1 rRNA maturation RNase YbeY [Actinomycetota bacterium]